MESYREFVQESDPEDFVGDQLSDDFDDCPMNEEEAVLECDVDVEVKAPPTDEDPLLADSSYDNYPNSEEEDCLSKIEFSFPDV